MGISIRQVSHDLNPVPHDYTVQLMNRFKQLYLVHRVPEEVWREVSNTILEAVNKTILKKKKCKKAKWLSEEALQITEERREAKSKGERERFTQLNAELQRPARRDKKTFCNEQCKETEAATERVRLNISPRKSEISKENFIQDWHNKGQKR